MTVDFLEREDYKTRLIDGSRIIHGYMGGPFLWMEECSLILIDFDQFYWLTMILNVLKTNATVKRYPI